MGLFSGRKAIIATKHKKETVIAPVLEYGTGLKCFTTDGLDTDSLGTFTGEVERKYDPVTAMRMKCIMAMDECGTNLAVKGLPVYSCGFPTKSTLKHICRCQKCAFVSEKLFPHEKHAEDPQYCDYCNPITLKYGIPDFSDKYY